MTNVRCPMCSHVNPPDVEVCSNCGARLKPNRPSTGLSTGSESESDWLDSLRSDSEINETASGGASSGLPEQQSGGENIDPSDMPDWLARIRERARLDLPESDGALEPEGEDPDWMKDFQDKPSDVSLSNQISDEERDKSSELFNEWIEQLPDQSAPETGIDSSSVGSTGDEQPFDDWLQSQTEQSVEPSLQGDDDWISKLSAWQAGQEQTEVVDSPEEEDKFFPSSVENDTSQVSGFGLTGFLASLEDKKESEQPQESEEWVNEETPSASMELLHDESVLGGEEETFTDGAYLTESESGENASGASDLPDWFTSFDETQEPGTEPSPVDAASSELPNWLLEDSTSPVSGNQEEAVSATASEGEINLPNAVEKGAFSEPEPGWGESIKDELTINQEMAPIPAEAAVDANGPELFYDDETPDWLRDFSAQSPDEQVDLVSAGKEEMAETSAVESDDRSLIGADLPDWLSDESQSVEMAASDQLSEPAEEEIARAELPEWVQEMKPIEAVIPVDNLPAETNQMVEKIGPLAGLRGVLQAEDLASRYRKPPVYSAKLRVSEKQRSQASLFESILAQETQPLLITPERSHAPRVFARILVALLFLTVLVFVRLFPFGIKPELMLTPPELRNMFNQIDQAAQPPLTVLLAVDYEPGRAGELKLASSPVIEHLMAKNARIVVLSTVPAGPALAHQLLVDVASDFQERSQQSYDIAAQTLNLGYLPGGTISLIEFAQIPSRAAPATLEGDYEAWHNTFLQDVTGIGDFSQIIVLTDSAETGRSWVEQVHPLMDATPLFMITSVQAAPMLMPYVQSGQIDGMVSGLLGGIIYSQWRMTESSANVYWESYQVGILLGFGIIFVGGLFSGLMTLIKRNHRGEA